MGQIRRNCLQNVFQAFSNLSLSIFGRASIAEFAFSLSLRPAATLGFRARRDCAQLCQIVCNILCITPLSSLIFACKAESQHKFGLIFLVSESKHVGQVKSPPKIDTCRKVNSWNMAKNSVSLQKCVCTKMVASFVSSDRSS